MVTNFTREHSEYTITSIIDLHGEVLHIPKNCTINFKGGSIINGLVICDNTTFKGRPSVEKISGTVANDEFHSSWVKNGDKFPYLCQLEAKRIVIDEDLTICSHTSNDFKSFELDGCGHTIKVDYDLYKASSLIRCFNSVKSIKNINFDFCNHEFHSKVLWFPHRTEKLSISNVSFAHLDNATVREYGFEGIGIEAKETNNCSFSKDIAIHLSEITASNLHAITDNSGKDGESTMTVVYVNSNVTSKSNVTVDINVNNCNFREIVVYDNEKHIVASDAACVYVHQDAGSTNSRVYISDISGYNFGRRLIKTDGSNIWINRIKGESYNGGSLCMVGCNNSDVPHSAKNAEISNLTFKGRISYVIACMVNNSTLKNIDAEFTDYIKPRVLSGVIFIGDDASCNIKGVNVKGKSFLYCSSSQTQATISDVTLLTDDSILGNHYLFNSFDIKSLELSNFTFIIKGALPTFTTYQNANPNTSCVNSQIVLRDGTINILGESGGSVITDYSTKHPYSLLIDNVSINVKRGVSPVISISSPTLKEMNVKNVKVEFKNTNSSARVMALGCNKGTAYSLSKITCSSNLQKAPILIKGASGSYVSITGLPVKEQVEIEKNVRVINK